MRFIPGRRGWRRWARTPRRGQTSTAFATKDDVLELIPSLLHLFVASRIQEFQAKSGDRPGKDLQKQGGGLLKFLNAPKVLRLFYQFRIERQSLYCLYTFCSKELKCRQPIKKCIICQLYSFLYCKFFDTDLLNVTDKN